MVQENMVQYKYQQKCNKIMATVAFNVFFSSSSWLRAMILFKPMSKGKEEYILAQEKTSGKTF